MGVVVTCIRRGGGSLVALVAGVVDDVERVEADSLWVEDRLGRFACHAGEGGCAEHVAETLKHGYVVAG